jgi:hypothetical protein
LSGSKNQVGSRGNNRCLGAYTGRTKRARLKRRKAEDSYLLQTTEWNRCMFEKLGILADIHANLWLLKPF